MEPASPVLYNRTRDRVVARAVSRPRGTLEWALGLLVRPPLRPGEALWLSPCGGIHTWAMRYPIDVLFLDEGLRVRGVSLAVKPWRLCFAPRGTRSVVELPAGTARGVEPGDQLSLEPDGGVWASA